MVAERDETIVSLKAELKKWEDLKAKKTKKPTKPNKGKVGFLRKRKKS